MQLFKFLMVVGFLLIQTVQAQAQDCGHTHRGTHNTLIPTVSVRLAPLVLGDNAAFAFLGEVGKHNYRANATAGCILGGRDLFKVSGEYLVQKLGYNFTDEKKHRYMPQAAAGASYKHFLPTCKILNNFELGGYYSYAHNRHLHNTTCGNLNISRRIAGSNAYGFSSGTEVNIFGYAFLRLSGNYDVVVYRRHFKSYRHISGFGGTASLHQRFFDFTLDLLAEFRRPFNYYRADLKWDAPYRKGVVVGMYGSYTAGKCRLASNAVFGIEFSYAFGCGCRELCYTQGCDGSVMPSEWFQPNTPSSALCCWISKPAVYMPEVLAISDPLDVACSVPATTGIPDLLVPFGNPTYTYDVSQFFTSPGGDPLTFTATGLPSSSSISSSGLISGTVLNSGEVFTVVVTATSRCGSVSSTFVLSFPSS